MRIGAQIAENTGRSAGPREIPKPGSSNLLALREVVDAAPWESQLKHRRAREVTHDELIGTLRHAAEEAGVFESVEVKAGRVICHADGSAEPAEYRVDTDAGRVWVSLVTADRWLSGSIESELTHTGDKLEELLEEEMADLGYDGPMPTFEHFRSTEMLFTFRTAVCDQAEDYEPSQADAIRMTLLGYEACFRQLGDMSESEE